MIIRSKSHQEYQKKRLVYGEFMTDCIHAWNFYFWSLSASAFNKMAGNFERVLADDGAHWITDGAYCLPPPLKLSSDKMAMECCCKSWSGFYVYNIFFILSSEKLN